ncbi:hypothetical protein PINS_up020425 [Pythium insidiosum]|nr:hypothetical protein PINS_up020425 [Pythium insidiosum]
MLFDVLSDCVAELEMLYVPHEKVFGRRKKVLEAEDWNEVFEGLEALVRNSIPLIHDGWKSHGFTLLFSKLLKRDNHALIKKYAFRCLALYTDATRNLQQLSAFGSTLLKGSSPTAAMTALLSSDMSDGSADDESTTATRGTINLSSAPNSRQATIHLELLRESVDFSPYGGGSIQLPDKFVNQGVHVEGWIRSTPTQAEEPVDMLKFIMDLSLEREDAKVLTNPKVNHKARGDRFEFWTELIMRFYMPLLYPKICMKVKLKDENDQLGFFHHCPGSFQRVVARWIYKLRSKPECMETLWSRRELSEVIMETMRQRFAYRDNELVLDAIKFYSGICSGGQYVPIGMQNQINETCRSMISHVSQLFHPSVQLEDPKILLNCIELLELVSQRHLDDYSSTYLRKFVISTIDNCATLRDPANVAILRAMLSVVLHVWMHAAVVAKATSGQVWLELTIAIRRWLVSPNDSKAIGAELINCWKRELRFTSCLLMCLMDDGQSTLKISSDGVSINPLSGAAASSGAGSSPADALGGKQSAGYVQAAATFLMNAVQDVPVATVLLDRVLHLIPPPTVNSLTPLLHLTLLEGMLQLVELWIDSAICSQRATPTALHRISPSTIIALFGEWFLPACELDGVEYQNSRCLALVILCKLCTVRCIVPLTPPHIAILARVLYKGVTSLSGVIVSTVLRRAAPIFTMNFDGMNALVPAFVYAVDQIIVQNIWHRAEQSKGKSSEWNRELNAALDIVFSVAALPKRFPSQDFVSWPAKTRAVSLPGVDDGSESRVRELLDEIPQCDEKLHVIIGRVLLRIANLPFTDVVPIKKKALWGLYSLIVMHLTNANSGVAGSRDKVTRDLLADWIVKLIEFCHSLDYSVSMTALSVLQDLADYHVDIHTLDPRLVSRLVMTLAVFAQQQVEEASIEVQSAIESHASANQDGSIDSGANSSITNGDNISLTGSGRGSTVPAQRIGGRASELTESSGVGEANGSQKIKTPLKPMAGPPSTPAQQTSNTISNGAVSKEIPTALRLIVQKTASIFECLRVWVMNRPEVLLDDDVKKILFSAVEAALVGTLPSGEWQREVERARAAKRRMSMPLLFLGLQMRASLDNNDASQAWIKCFEETSMAAEGLLMHLLHHVNGFPSPAGIDQMVSSCSEICEETTLDVVPNSEFPAAPLSVSFVYMNSMIFTVVGSVDSPCARFIARDMTGLFTWDIMPAPTTLPAREVECSPSSLTPRSPRSADRSSSTKERELLLADDGGNSNSLKGFRLHQANAAVRVETKPSVQETKGGNLPLCPACGRERRRRAASAGAVEPVSTIGTKLEVLQIPRKREEAMLSNSICQARGSYTFHEDPDGGGSTSGTVASSDVEKEARGTGNHSTIGDDRQERLQRVAKLHEERNNIGLGATSSKSDEVQPSGPNTVCECRSNALMGTEPIAICGLFEMDKLEPNVGSLDDERSLLDLILDAIPMIFRDCGGDTIDKTLLGGKHTLNRYNYLEMRDVTNPLIHDAADGAGYSFLQRLIHDEECYALLKSFVVKEEGVTGKELIEFCDAVKKYERTMAPTDRLGQACTIYWEYCSADGGRTLLFPTSVSLQLQQEIQSVQRAVRSGNIDGPCLRGTLFDQAMAHLESHYFDGAGLLDRFVSSLESQTSSNGTDAAKPASAKDISVPPQLSLFDSFSIMEANARISHLALTYRGVEANHTSIRSLLSARRSAGLLQTTPRVSPLDVCRLFLGQTCLLPGSASDAAIRDRFKLLETGPKLERSLKHLDKSPVRETMKIGVIYVGPKQRTQQEILRNDGGSTSYERFVSQLGWAVDLLQHRGFAGGLDCNPKSLSNGRHALYFASAHSEVVFHVVTMMPTKPSDPQQIDKKRHVGNDYVHIVWSENDAFEYDPSTITSHFNDVQIVIYPLRRSQEGLYLIRIHSKDKVAPFGPLQSGMVVFEADLPTLVRQTAMNANRVCRSQTMIYVRPYPTRKKLVDEIVERYATEYQESQLLPMLFASPSSTQGSATDAVNPNP